MYRNSQILYETGDYLVSSYTGTNYSIKIYLNSNLTLIADKIPCPYIKVYFNINGEVDSITSRMCRLSLLEPKYLGYEYEDLIFSDIEKDIFVDFLSDHDFKVWKNIIFHLYHDFKYDKIYTEYLSMPDYSKLQTSEYVYLNHPEKIDPIASSICKYHESRSINLFSFYKSLKRYNSNIIHQSRIYTYTLDTDPYRFRVYDMKEFKNNLDDSPYRLYDIKTESFIPNEFYSDLNDNEIILQSQYTSEICNIEWNHFDFIFSIYEILVLLISSKLNLSFDKLMQKI